MNNISKAACRYLGMLYLVEVDDGQDRANDDLSPSRALIRIWRGRITRWLGGRSKRRSSVTWEASRLCSVDVASLLEIEAGEPQTLEVDVASLLNPRGSVPEFMDRGEYYEYRTCIEIMRGLGPEESLRRLTLFQRPSGSGGSPSHAPEERHG